MQWVKRVEELDRAQLPYALATVVVRRSPVSAHLGDRAIVMADGRMEGFVGGSCSRDIVRRQGLDAIRTGVPRLLQIRPDPLDAAGGDNADMVVVPMGCASEGAVDVYIEPHLPPRMLLIVGHTPVAEALARLGSVLEGYRVQRIVAGDEIQDLGDEAAASAIAIESLAGYLAALGAERGRLVAIVASQGHYDERALAMLLSGIPQTFVGLLASRKRAASVFGALEQDGVPRERLAEVRNPVGLDLGARTPGEVAVAILAEIVAACVPRAEIERDGGHHCCHT
ncbi:MAG TPA: XdhC family protein [Candidatus Aquilonibacter sp.]